VLPIFELTEGSACTVLKAEKIINNDEPLIIANADQIIDINFNDFVNDAFERYLDGSIITFKNFEKNSKWSFVKVDDKMRVTEVREKEVISNNATAGVYFFKKGSFFINGALDMISRKDKVNGEYYTCPVYNYLLKQSPLVGIYEILEKQMHGIGTPEDLNIYLNKI
jgi:dTDP-glucose pyrophosphorylase